MNTIYLIMLPKLARAPRALSPIQKLMTSFNCSKNVDRFRRHIHYILDLPHLWMKESQK